ncbi:MAG: nucleoside deaminase, partial [Kiritimatiellae bacterium]|nr:nucleoside deaminase [Kiritimatiellia bacterium]
LRDPTAHAEVIAIGQAASETGDWRLTDCALYVTKEPCPMCGGAAVLGRLALVAWAAADPKRGAHTVFGMFAHPGLNHRPAVLAPVGSPEALAELQSFFRARREGGGAKKPFSAK